jgi:hypothetical protein
VAALRTLSKSELEQLSRLMEKFVAAAGINKEED